MPEDSFKSLVNLGNLSKPATVLVKKISNAVGGVFEPWQIRRIATAERDAMVQRAQAEQEVAMIQTQSEIQVTDLHRRAANRWIDEEARRQKNMEDITARALPSLNENANPDAIEDDWLVNFFDKCRIVSDQDMQNLWSRILAGEANVQGSYSNRTVNFLSDLDKSEAGLFARLCGFVWQVNMLPIPLVLDERDDIYTSHGINFNALDQLDGIGLIRFRTTGHTIDTRDFNSITWRYYGKPMILETTRIANGTLTIGKVLLTKIGEELVSICESKPVEGFYEFIKARWTHNLQH